MTNSYTENNIKIPNTSYINISSCNKRDLNNESIKAESNKDYKDSINSSEMSISFKEQRNEYSYNGI